MLLLGTGCTRLSLLLESPPRGRLPDDVRPLRYELELTLRPDRDRFSGRVVVELLLSTRRRSLWLHGRDLAVSRVRARSGDRLVSGRWEQRSEDGVARVRLERPVGPGRVLLELDYQGPFDRALRGLYRVEAGGESYGFTQFEPIAARRAFPCFDEPAFKTPFDVTLVVPEGQVALASMPVAREEPAAAGLHRIRFETTPPLPTYLIAVAVGPLDLVEAPLESLSLRAGGIPFRGAAVRGRGDELAFALRITPPLLRELERYFASGYPYPKLDLVAVPDFAAGAMENVGLITFRDGLLLLDEAQAPEGQRRAAVYVMAHELAHQWFGNLVTMEWWDDLWLNEAFATWLGFRAVERTFPEQRAGLTFQDRVLWAMSADSLVSARSIRQPIEANHDIRNAFDAITYSKGGGVLAMFERWLGEETFRQGVHRYLAAHREGSARTEDLLAALSEAAGRDVSTPFQSFLTQPGVPFLEVESRCSDGRGRLALRQSRYLPVGSTGDRERLWQVPVCARYRSGAELRESCTLLDAAEGELTLEGECPAWVMPNADGSGYYRFALSGAAGDAAFETGWSELSPRERRVMADSLLSALRAAARPAAEIYPRMPRLAGDPSRPVAEAPMELLRTTREHLVAVPTRPAVERFGRELYRPLFERLGWSAGPDEDGDTRLLRGSVARFLADQADDRELLAELAARGRREAGLDGPAQAEPLEPELVSLALGAALRQGDRSVFDALLRQLFASEDALERGHRLEALGRATQPDLARRARELSLDPRLRLNEVFQPLFGQAQQESSRADTWLFLREHFDELVARVGPEQGGALPWLAAGFCDEDRAREVERFFRGRIQRLVGGPRNLASSLEQIRLCAALVEAQSASAEAFFSAPGR